MNVEDALKSYEGEYAYKKAGMYGAGLTADDKAQYAIIALLNSISDKLDRLAGAAAPELSVSALAEKEKPEPSKVYFVDREDDVWKVMSQHTFMYWDIDEKEWARPYSHFDWGDIVRMDGPMRGATIADLEKVGIIR